MTTDNTLYAFENCCNTEMQIQIHTAEVLGIALTLLDGRLHMLAR